MRWRAKPGAGGFPLGLLQGTVFEYKTTRDARRIFRKIVPGLGRRSTNPKSVVATATVGKFELRGARRPLED